MKHLAGILLVCALAADPLPTVTITTTRLSRTPISPNIYGAVLEHIGQQMDTMWAELLQDNSFEGLRPFTDRSENWAEGKIDPSRFWWHSGYELHPWRAFGTGAGANVGTSFGNNLVNGIHGIVIANNGDRPAGIAQDGIPVRAGMTYRFEGYLNPTGQGRRVPGNDARVTVGLYADAALTRPYARATLELKTPGFRKYSATLAVSETNDNATFALAVEPPGFAAVDLLSLMPSDNLSGWRADVVAALQAMGLRSFRYPGGVFASFVDWETMVGPPIARTPYTNPYWGGLEPNHVGTDEFLRLMELANGEPLLCGNLITGTPEKAAAWIEYCNGSVETRYGKMRAHNGHPRPYGVKYWELENEPQRRFSAAQYAEQCRIYTAAMKAVDPKAQFMAVGYFWSDPDLLLLLARAADVIDFLSVRTTDSDELDKLQALCDRYSRPRHPLRLAATEWRNRFRHNEWIPLRLDNSLRKAETTWGHGLECARTLQKYQRRSGYVGMAMFPSVTNLYGEDLMNIGKSAITYTASGQVVKFMSDIRGEPLDVGQVPDLPGAVKLEVNAVIDEPHRRLICTLVYGEPAESAVRLDLRAWPRIRPAAKLETLASSTLENRAPDSIRQTEKALEAHDGIFAIPLAPYSVNKVILEIAP